MNIVQEKTGELTASLKVKLQEEDYLPKVDKALKDMQKKANMPGFRPGKVPMGMIKKMYGKSVLVEEVNKILVDAVYDYIRDNKLNVLGNPLPDNEKINDVDWDNPAEFEFVYEIGLAPEINIDFSQDIKVDYHKIKIEDSILNETISDIQKRQGSFINPETVEAEDILFGEFTELDGDGNVIENGLTNKAKLAVQYIKDQEVKNALLGSKVGDSVNMDLVKAIDNETEMASLLGVKKEELDGYSKNFRYSIEEISRIEPAELNQELYTKVAPDESFANEQEFKDFIAKQLQNQYQADVDKNFKNEAVKKLLEVVNLSLPEEFLKRWLIESNKDNSEITPEQVENEFVSYADSFKWQLVENYLIKENKIEVKHEEVSDYLKNYMRMQLRQYGQNDPDEEVLNDFVKRIASNQEELKKVYDQLFENKVTNLLKEKLNLVEKELTFDEFVKEMTEKYQNTNQKQD
jgi:trigger factor